MIKKMLFIILCLLAVFLFVSCGGRYASDIYGDAERDYEQYDFGQYINVDDIDEYISENDLDYIRTDEIDDYIWENDLDYIRTDEISEYLDRHDVPGYVSEYYVYDLMSDLYALAEDLSEYYGDDAIFYEITDILYDYGYSG